MSQLCVDLLGFHKTCNTDSTLHEVYVSMSESLKLQVFTEIQ